MQLTKNFKLSEFTDSDTATAKGIDNTPTDEHLENIKFVAEQLQLIRNTYKQPINISSGYRCEELNTEVNGSKSSQHMQGLAVDINQGSRTKNHNLFLIVKRMMKVGLKVHQLIDEQNFKWIHIGFKQDNPRGEIKHLK